MAYLAAETGAVPVVPAAPVAHVKSVVRTDTRSGRLVRKVVAPKPEQAGAAAPRMAELIEQAAGRHEVDPHLVRSVVAVESNFNPYAVSPKGAQGLMQLMPATARRFGVANAFDAAANLEAGVKYLKYLKELFKDERLALAAYNAGEGAVQRHRGVPPYAETRDYVEKVRRLYGTAVKKPAPATAPATAPGVDPGSRQVEPEPLRGLETFVGPDGRVYLRSR